MTSIERQFAKRARELRRTPRPRAWDRLEHRLDARVRRRRVGWYRLAGIAAGVLLLVGLTWTLTQSTYEAQRPGDVLAELAVPAVDAAGSLPVTSQAAAAAYRRRARLEHRSPIIEGDREKQLVVVAPDGRKRLPTIAPAPERTGLENISRLRVRPAGEWESSL